MIRKPKTPAIAWAFVALAIGFGLTLALWWVQFVDTYWGLGGNNVLRIDAADALRCLAPWKVLDCRAMFQSAGYGDLKKVVSKMAMVQGPWIVGVGLFIVGAYGRWFAVPYRRILSGNPIGDITDLRSQMKSEMGNPGLEISPGWQIKDKRESTHFLMLAGTGGGKTTIQGWMLESIIARDDKVILYAEKTNFIARCPIRAADDPFILLAPHDRRSWVWSIAGDVVDRAAAIRIAGYLVPEEQGHNKFFSDAARAVVTGIMLYLRHSAGSSWKWGHLLSVSEQPLNELDDLVTKHYGPAGVFLNSEKRLASSIQGSIQNAILQLQFLSIAWDDADNRPSFSIREYLLTDRLPKTLMIGRSGDYSEMSEKWISLFFMIASDTIKSESFKPSHGHRLWFTLDELAQLPKIPRISDLLATGREKGASVVLGLQDLHQIKKTYGDDEVQTWFTNIGTKVYGLTRSGETQMLMSRLIGDVRVRDKKMQPTSSGGMYDAGNEWTEAAMLPSDFQTELGERKKGESGYVVMLAADVGRHPCLIEVPFRSFKQKRDGYLPASWIAKGPKELAAIDERIARNAKEIAKGTIILEEMRQNGESPLANSRAADEAPSSRAVTPGRINPAAFAIVERIARQR